MEVWLMYSATEIKTALRKYLDSTGDTSIDEQRIIKILDMGSNRDFASISGDIYKIRQEFGVKRSIPEWMKMLTFRLVYDAMASDKNAKQEELLKTLGFNKKVFDGTSWQMYSPDMKLRQSRFNPVNFPFSYAEVESNPIYVAMLHHLISEAKVATNTFVDVFGKMGYVPAFCAEGYAHKLIFTDNNSSYMNYYEGITERPTRTYAVLEEYMDSVKKILEERLDKDDREKKIRAIVADFGLLRNLCSENFSNHAAARFTYMCFTTSYWENRNVDYNSEEKFIIDDFSSIKKAKAFLDIRKEDFVAYAQALKKVEYTDETNVLLSVFEDNMNAADMYPDYDFGKELAEDLKTLVGDEKPLLYVDAPKMSEYKRFEYDSRQYMLLLESLLCYDGDWILTFKNRDIEDDSYEEIEKYAPKDFMDFMKTSKRLLYKYKFTTTDRNIRNGICFITNIDFDNPTAKQFQNRYQIKLPSGVEFKKEKINFK